ncbi:uncharacterized protein LOC122554215 [Chiloscyllium plagiosum]|uniref:uncharacterized protein LOC122554215 n=1 Tax=Chiloscyllium plagiosum TaxID=36176 RepID=UPI001CB7F08E|nr:uncharacterized protein LOC122554215 [Chiloscyllium plagiosum]
MRANRQQTNGKITNHRWDSKLFSYSRWEVNDSVNDDGYYLLQPCQPRRHFKCKDLDVEAIIISSQLSNSAHGSSKEIESCMNEEYFAGRKGKHSPLQQITSKDLNEYATNSQNTTEPISRKCTTVPLVRKLKSGQQKSDIPNATCSDNKCANPLVPIPNHVHHGNELKGQAQVMQSRSTISECDDQENSSYCKNSSQACELSTAKELLFISKSRLSTHSKIERKNKHSKTCSEEKRHWKEEPFQVQALSKKSVHSRMLNKFKNGIACSTMDKNKDGSCIRENLINKQINGKSTPDSDNSAVGLSESCLKVCSLQPTLDMAREDINALSYKSGCGKHDHTSDFLQSLSKEGMEWKRQNYQPATVTLMEDKNSSAEASEFITLYDQQEFQGTQSVATGVVLPAFRQYPFQKTLQRNKLQSQAKWLQENNSIKMYHCTSRTSDEQSVQNIAEMAPSENHITTAQLLHTIRYGMHQNEDIIQINSLLKENHRTKGMNSKHLEEALILYSRKTKEMH